MKWDKVSLKVADKIIGRNVLVQFYDDQYMAGCFVRTARNDEHRILFRSSCGTWNNYVKEIKRYVEID